MYLVLAWRVPHETAAVPAQVLYTPYNHALCHFMQSHIRKVYACLAVTYHLHFWQNDRDLLRATGVTRGGTGTEIRVSTESRHWRIFFSRRSCRDSNPRPFDHESGALTTELSPPPWVLDMYYILWATGNQIAAITQESVWKNATTYLQRRWRKPGQSAAECSTERCSSSEKEQCSYC